MTLLSNARACIGLPVYNGQKYVAQAIESILAQTFTHFQLIISDNASTDGTEDICRSYARRDPRIRYVRESENRGAAWNYNRVFHLADAEYFKWSAHDDVCAPTFLERCIEVLDRNPRVVLCYPKTQILNEQSAVVGTYEDPFDGMAPTPYERFASVVSHPCLYNSMFGVMRRTMLRHTQLHRAYPTSDATLLSEIALRGQMYVLDERLFLWRDHVESATRSNRTHAAWAVWFDPANAGRIPLRHGTLFFNHLRTVLRVPLPFGQRLRCAWLLARWPLVRRPQLRKDIGVAVARLRGVWADRDRQPPAATPRVP